MKKILPLLGVAALLTLSACESLSRYKDKQVPVPPDTSVNYDRDAPEIHRIMKDEPDESPAL